MKISNIIITIVLIVGAVALGWWRYNNETTHVPLDQLAGIDVVTHTAQSEVAIETMSIEYMPGIQGYLARPAGTGPYPGLLLIHEWWGLNENIKTLAQDFAREGYVALAVDLYEGKTAGDDPAQARVLASAVRDDVEGAFANLQAALEYVQRDAKVDQEKLASVGWCFGGGWAYQMAKNDLGVAASIMYYGQFNPDDDLSMMRADILGHFGEEDTSIAVDTVREFEANLATMDGNHHIFIYPNAGHAFANEDNEMTYVPEAAELSWQRTMEFLQTEFGE